MQADIPPGPLEPDKHADVEQPGGPVPEAAEVESARLLANQAGPRLRQAGLDDEEIARLADDFVACDRGEDLDAFVTWARAQTQASPGPRGASEL
jgi:hypothetical protein